MSLEGNKGEWVAMDGLDAPPTIIDKKTPERGVPEMGKDKDTRLLKVLSSDELIQKEGEARQESKAKTAAKVAVRLVAFNLDLVLLLVVVILASIVGYTFARVFGLSPQEIKQEVGEYISFFMYFVLLIVGCVSRLAVKDGLIAQAIQDTVGKAANNGISGVTSWVKDIFSPKSELKWNVLTSQSTEEYKAHPPKK
jgi:hypothetical protein